MTCHYIVMYATNVYVITPCIKLHDIIIYVISSWYMLAHYTAPLHEIYTTTKWYMPIYHDICHCIIIYANVSWYIICQYIMIYDSKSWYMSMDHYICHCIMIYANIWYMTVYHDMAHISLFTYATTSSHHYMVLYTNPYSCTVYA